MSDTPHNVLIAEDDMLNQRVIEMQVKRLGCTVEIANNGKEAVSKFCQGKFSLVLMDYEMPLMTGVQACIAIRAYEKENNLPATPIYAMTGHFATEELQRCTDAGMNSHLTKPLTVEALREIIAPLDIG